MRKAKVKPIAGLPASPAPWQCADDGTIIAADGKTVCVLGVPEDDMAEQDVSNGALILAAPELLAALCDLVNSPNSKQNAMWDRARAALAKAEGRR